MKPSKGESYLDLTAGYGGHARAVVERTGEPGKAVLVDRDAMAVDHLKQVEELAKATVIRSDFAAACDLLKKEGRRFDLVLLDLGVSSPQLDIAERGFSFAAPAPLDMRMDREAGETAAEMIDRLGEDELIRIITEYGEEPQARRIARAIVANRPITTTDRLAEVVAKATRRPRGKTHPATRTFQAIRIAVNDELGQLERALDTMPDLLNPGARLGVISFHSLEDRIVKRFFKERSYGYEAEFTLLTRKPVQGSDHDVHNPRARSAKLRVALVK